MEQNRIEVGFEYPQFREGILGAAASGVNQHVVRYVTDAIQRFIEAAADLTPTPSSPSWYLQSSFSVSIIRGALISIRFALTSYTGGMHGAHWTEPFNAWTRPVRAFGIDEIFTDPAAGTGALSNYAITRLLDPAEGGGGRAEHWVREGAGPDAKNFRSFNLTSRGILLTFDEYQVGSYAEGASEVHVPYDEISELLVPVLAAQALSHDA
jgi:hypothetical protein